MLSRTKRIHIKGDEIHHIQLAQLALNEFGHVASLGYLPIIENVELKRDKRNPSCISVSGIARIQDDAARFTLSIKVTKHEPPSKKSGMFFVDMYPSINPPPMHFGVAFAQALETHEWELILLSISRVYKRTLFPELRRLLKTRNEKRFRARFPDRRIA